MSKVKDATKYYSLADAVQSLKIELLKATTSDIENGNPLLVFKECEVELSLEFAPKVEAGFNVGFFAIKTSADSKGSHKVKLKFEANRPLVAAAQAASAAPARIPAAKSTKSLATKK